MLHDAVQPESLTVRRLAVVDEKGTERVVISARLPEPMINGKREKRDGPASGMLIYDPKGNERSGYVTSDGGDLAALLALDSENEQVFTAYANAGSGATVWVANEKHQNVVMSTHNTAVLEITNGRKVVYKQPPGAADLKHIVTLNRCGSASSAAPTIRCPLPARLRASRFASVGIRRFSL